MKLFSKKPVQKTTQNTNPVIDGETVNYGKMVAQRKEIAGILGRSGYHTENQYTRSLPEDLKNGAENLSGMDMSDVKVHHNSSKPSDINAHAYTQGEDIYLAPGQETHLPHETWHVIQQKQRRVNGGIQAAGAVINTDAGLEREADLGGDMILGSSGTKLTGELEKVKGRKQIQRKAVKTYYGTFNITEFKFIDGKEKLKIKMNFVPSGFVSTSMVALIQISRFKYGGKNIAIDPNAVEKMSTAGWAIDKNSEYANPLFAASKKKKKGTKGKRIEDYGIHSDGKIALWGTHGKKVGNMWIPAQLIDSPTVYEKMKGASLELETIVMGINDKGTPKYRYYSSIRWGWKVNANGVAKEIPVSEVPSSKKKKHKGISADFHGAIEAWNKSKTKGEYRAKVQTTAYTLLKDDSLGATGTIKANDVVKPIRSDGKEITGETISLPDTTFINGESYINVEYPSWPGTETGLVKVSDLKDDGSGEAVIALPKTLP